MALGRPEGELLALPGVPMGPPDLLLGLLGIGSQPGDSHEVAQTRAARRIVSAASDRYRVARGSMFGCGGSLWKSGS